jgi:hypothetical protein
LPQSLVKHGESPLFEEPGPVELDWRNVLAESKHVAHDIGRGRNSKVRKIEFPDRVVIAKQYFEDLSDNRDRLGAETAAFELFDELGIETTPRLLAIDRRDRIVIMEYIEGEEVVRPGKKDISQTLAFLSMLWSVARQQPLGRFQSASEAYFRAEDIVENIRHRRRRLDQVPPECPLHAELKRFLSQNLDPCLDRYVTNCRETLEQKGLSFTEEVPLEERTLSPSDFGFHNAIKRTDGRLCFIDFEYFGWDDPAKTLCDFVLHPHPAMQLEEMEQADFTKGFLQDMEAGPGLHARAAAYYPLYRLKWCLILLNEFLPEGAARRSFSGFGRAYDVEKLRLQLDKAVAMCTAMEHEYERFLSHMA